MMIKPSARVKTGAGIARLVGFTGSKERQGAIDDVLAAMDSGATPPAAAVSLLRRNAGRRITPRRAKHTRGRKPIEE
jgi:hypothetical protein